MVIPAAYDKLELILKYSGKMGNMMEKNLDIVLILGGVHIVQCVAVPWHRKLSMRLEGSKQGKK